MATAYIGLGSNLGERQGYIHSSLEFLREHDNVNVEQVSLMLETPAVAMTNQPDYLNCVAKLQTDLKPDGLLAVLNSIEDRLGRIRKERYSERTIDLDILLYDDVVMNEVTLQIPHPQMHLRSFVLEGMAEVASDLRHPVIGESMAVLKSRLNGQSFMIPKDQPKLISIAGIIGIGKTTSARSLSKQFNCPVIQEAYDTNPYISDVYAGRDDLALKSQLYFLHSRAKQLALGNLKVNEPVISDYIFEKDNIFASMTLTEQEYEVYRKQYCEIAEKVVKPQLVIRLVDSPLAALERIHRRNREYEQGIKQEFLTRLADEYAKLFDYKAFTTCPVITINTSSFDGRVYDDVRKLAEQARKYLWI